MPRTARRALAAITAAAALIFLPTPGRGDSPSDWQFLNFMPGGMYGGFDQRGFRPPVTERDLKAMARTLGLDEDQKETLTDLMRSLISEYKIEWVQHREAAVDAELESDDAQTDWQAQQIRAMEERAGLEDTQAQLLERMFEDLRLVLTPEQEARWPDVERDRRRATTLTAYALFDQEAVDLVSITSALDLSDADRAAIDPVLERYADELDPLLSARNRAARNLGEKGVQFTKDQSISREDWQTDPEKAQQRMMQAEERKSSLIPEALAVRDASAKIRDITRRFIDELRPLIPESERDDWNKAVSAEKKNPFEFFQSQSRAAMAMRMIESLESQVAAFSTWFGEDADDSQAEMFAILRGAEPLSPSQRDALESLKERHDAEEKSIRERHRPTPEKTVNKDDPSTLNIQTPQGTAMLRRNDAAEDDGSGWGAWGGQEPDEDMMKDIRALDLKSLRELRDILTINQRAAICMW